MAKSRQQSTAGEHAEVTRAAMRWRGELPAGPDPRGGLHRRAGGRAVLMDDAMHVTLEPARCHDERSEQAVPVLAHAVLEIRRENVALREGIH
jgi:hypothetical protein